MNQHVVDYYIRCYNQLESSKKYYSVKPEYGGSKRKDWRACLDSINNEQTKMAAKIESLSG